MEDFITESRAMSFSYHEVFPALEVTFFRAAVFSVIRGSEKPSMTLAR